MRIVASLEVSMQVIEKYGNFYAMVWDVETNNLIYEQDFLTRQGAESALVDFVLENLRKQ